MASSARGDPAGDDSARRAIRALTEDLAAAPRIGAWSVEALPETPGLYGWWFADADAAREVGFQPAAAGAPAYVGLATLSLRRRIAEHLDADPLRTTEFGHRLLNHLALYQRVIPWREDLLLETDRWRPSSVLGPYVAQAVSQWMNERLLISHVPLPSSISARLVESAWIRHLNPMFNQAATDRLRRGDEWRSRILRLGLPIAWEATVWSLLLTHRLVRDRRLLVHLREVGDVAMDLRHGPRGRIELKVHRTARDKPYGSWICVTAGQMDDPEAQARAIPNSWYRKEVVERFGEPPAREEILGRLDADERALVTLYETLDFELRELLSSDLPVRERPR